MRPSHLILIAAALLLAAPVGIDAQRGGGGGRAQGAPPTPKSDAAIDITGTWTAVISEDWALRMVTPKKGDYTRVPMTPAARKIADSWDPARDEAAGEQCKSYGAPALMSVPGRLHITWQDDNTLKVETDAGRQVRTFHFAQGAAAGGEASRQGYSVANWEMVAGGDEGKARWGTLRVVTRGLKPGYLRRNGVPYSENTVVTEYYDLLPPLPNRDPWFTVTTIVNDPKYLTQEFITSTDFKQERDGSKWSPSPCEAS